MATHRASLLREDAPARACHYRLQVGPRKLRHISRASYDAILAGTLTLADAKSLGRDRGPDTSECSGGPGTARETPGRGSAQGGADTPPQPVSRILKDDATQECWCGCGERTKPNRKWRPGHDQRAKGVIKRAVREGKVEELSDQLREYGAERGLL
jgi:hypothetical protein